MKKLKPMILFTVSVFAMTFFISCTKSADNAKLQMIKFTRSGNVILNPGKGWVLYEPYEWFFNNFIKYPEYNFLDEFLNSERHGIKYSEVLDMGTVGYQRYNWRDINPAEGEYRWDIIEDDINKWSAVGKQFAFGVMGANTHTDWQQISSSENVPSTIVQTFPNWLIDKGMQTHLVKGESGDFRTHQIPVWNDPIYVSECKKFAEEMAKKFNGNSNIAYIDIRKYGNWGEMHMYPFWDIHWHPMYQVSDIELKALIQPYIDNFTKTQLVICWPEYHTTGSHNYQGDNITAWAVANNIGLRRDGIMGRDMMDPSIPQNQRFDSDPYGAHISLHAVGKTPVIWEFLGGYYSLKEGGLWTDERFLNAVKEYKPSYIGLGNWGSEPQYMFAQNPNLVKETANLMGYHFFMESAKYFDSMKSGAVQQVTISIRNDGVTNLLLDNIIKLVLLDEQDNVVSTFNTNWDAKTFEAGTTALLNANVTFTAQSGDYKLAIGLFVNNNDEKPTYKMENCTTRTDDGYYVIGNLKIK